MEGGGRTYEFAGAASGRCAAPRSASSSTLPANLGGGDRTGVGRQPTAGVRSDELSAPAWSPFPAPFDLRFLKDALDMMILRDTRGLRERRPGQEVARRGRWGGEAGTGPDLLLLAARLRSCSAQQTPSLPAKAAGAEQYVRHKRHLST